MNTVLLAEDEPVSQRFLQQALQTSGYGCEVAPDGASALRLAQAHGFDLLLLDVNLPQLSGIEVLARLRREPAAASHRSPAVALTADDDGGLRSRLLAAGFAAVGGKPLAVAALAAMLHAVLRDRATVTTADREPEPWDDAAALRAVGGSRDIVTGLRALMQKELPAQRQSILAAIDRADAAAARAELHRLRAACGFCGAAELSRAVDALHADLASSATEPMSLARWLFAIDRLIPNAPD